MKGKVGTSTSIYHTRLPHQWKLERMFPEELSEKARLRLKWMTHFKQKGNANLTCRHFDISRSKFYCWLDRFCTYGLGGLEDRSRAPKNKRRSNAPWQVVDLVVRTRREHPPGANAR